MSEIDFGRLLTAMITPFDQEGNVDYAQAEKLAHHLVETGTDTIVVCGTTGESPTLSWDEEYQLFTVIKQEIAGKAKIMAGTGSNSTSEAISATQKAAHLGLDGTLQVTPYYNKPPQEGLYQHFRAIAKAAPELPILLYNVPGRTGCKLEPETVARLAEIPSIIGIKEATGDLDQASLIRALTPTEFAIYSGDDSLTLPLMAVGAKGVVSVASHLVGNQLQAMMQSFATGKFSEALQIHLQLFPLFKALFLTTNPIPLKLALRLVGLDTGVVRSPLVVGNDELEAKLKAVLINLGIIAQ
ncbi:MAG: 4-hydroxy-tetrahydrodipicolinate synthase [Pseudanabaena sp.]|jgi:4-hydroxy-tetrahydrodipicolinate synthase|uniref:4-hydroxy-tetrahydrodipicolinate synthase n=1 Tax=Pseudanabaena mucicola TaxID=71190 RepID=UPI0025774D1B|nr:4-hydroxy-tetrahydrodipicolinate synthase [Pseudanabaena mucicola]MCA6574557.1 4-hydroxy-tetrahydrodipicolinate synthase [Pseudanabaena sp. M53BS1SP1A06MG]MCA6582330.1 4-hydroxy-tetrahydrodipicolinate synthase [Pseudanabaena sp. M34BS1SP1A06MG]MCA6585088.1 4-hydroxy-tetrahydrodipicolinate synthase [Pseudanabaena sp. M051S1SP1A06QC]MCA6589495.1 4-hydroxy-tetrahydrodipicolinate synthase [Pseudanabaena sp. M109S1SP1A06QC]MCA6592260.1 4-hydroxy-tetrahydrodipicolinate synthase [Pseudanabaena sp.